ncbi:MAG TPA: hypothetical protein VIK65_04440 [Candidatus Limnocylindrales bacterium]|jgi:hypothetical protein
MALRRGTMELDSTLFQLARRLLRLDFVQADDRAVDIDAGLVEVVGYCPTVAFSGLIRLSAPRLTDLLNRSDEVELHDVVIQRLADDRVLDTNQARLPLSELLAVRAGPPRGDPARRRPTRKTAVAGVTGPYGFHGYLHTRPGADPALDVARRPPMIPLTDARMRHMGRADMRAVEAATLIVNRTAARWIRPARDGDASLSWRID